MTIPFQSRRYIARFATTRTEVAACQTLRQRCFFGGTGRDQDHFDRACRHMMVADRTGRLVATARLLELASGAEIERSYAAQFYDLRDLKSIDAPMIEIGRFCTAPDVHDADVLRTAWGALTGWVETQGVTMLFGSTSFPGIDVARYGRVFSRLAARHLGPDHLRPKPKSQHAIAFSQVPAEGADPMPPLLRTYLAMGGWVSDHAVIDREMNTLHVFTGLQVDAVPPARAAALRALAQVASLH